MTKTRAGTPAGGAGTALLSFDQIVAADDIAYDIVETPEWGGAVRLGSLTGRERLRLVEAMKADVEEHGEDGAEQLAVYRILAASIVDADGNRLPEPGAAAELLQAKSNAPIQRLFDASRALSAIGESELDKRVDELGKADPSDASSTD